MYNRLNLQATSSIGRSRPKMLPPISTNIHLPEISLKDTPDPWSCMLFTYDNKCYNHIYSVFLHIFIIILIIYCCCC